MGVWAVAILLCFERLHTLYLLLQTPSLVTSLGVGALCKLKVRALALPSLALDRVAFLSWQRLNGKGHADSSCSCGQEQSPSIFSWLARSLLSLSCKIPDPKQVHCLLEKEPFHSCSPGCPWFHLQNAILLVTETIFAHFRIQEQLTTSNSGLCCPVRHMGKGLSAVALRERKRSQEAKLSLAVLGLLAVCRQQGGIAVPKGSLAKTDSRLIGPQLTFGICFS